LKAFQDHYERRMKIWSYALSFLVVVWLNQNLFDIYKEFSGSKTLRDSAVKMAERLAAIPKDSLIIVTVKGKKDSLIKVPDSLARKEIERQIGRINTMVNDSSFHIMRWNAPNGNKMNFSKFLGMEILPSWDNLVDGFRRNFMGWLAMTFLVGLGAPFWYDTLQAVMGLKETLKKK
ncbi:MAG TPA: hypothetical protein VI338_02045, partial [Nitrososphaera sp.]|nr:hypothetical protein [Nitrososphaera sp.]